MRRLCIFACRHNSDLFQVICMQWLVLLLLCYNVHAPFTQKLNSLQHDLIRTTAAKSQN